MRKFFKVITILMIIATPILWMIWQDTPNWYKGDIETCGYCGTDIWSFLWFWLLVYGAFLLWLGICAIIFIKPLIIIFGLSKAHDYAKENKMYPHLQEDDEESEVVTKTPVYGLRMTPSEKEEKLRQINELQEQLNAMRRELK